jgi:hypothetical protein
VFCNRAQIKGVYDGHVLALDDQHSDLALLVVNPLAGPTESGGLSLPLTKVGELGAKLSSLLREGRKVSIVFDVRSGDGERMASMVRELQDQALALVASGVEEGGREMCQSNVEMVEAITIDLGDDGA